MCNAILIKRANRYSRLDKFQDFQFTYVSGKMLIIFFLLDSMGFQCLVFIIISYMNSLEF